MVRSVSGFSRTYEIMHQRPTDAGRDVPAIALTAYAAEHDRNEAVAAAVNHMSPSPLIRPTSSGSLPACVDRARLAPSNFSVEGAHT
jgi:CheY-like chemotaxis protein